jgi:hypothetical protein
LGQGFRSLANVIRSIGLATLGVAALTMWAGHFAWSRPAPISKIIFGALVWLTTLIASARLLATHYRVPAAKLVFDGILAAALGGLLGGAFGFASQTTGEERIERLLLTAGFSIPVGGLWGLAFAVASVRWEWRSHFSKFTILVSVILLASSTGLALLIPSGYEFQRRPITIGDLRLIVTIFLAVMFVLHAVGRRMGLLVHGSQTVVLLFVLFATREFCRDIIFAGAPIEDYRFYEGVEGRTAFLTSSFSLFVWATLSYLVTCGPLVPRLLGKSGG